MVLLPFKAPVNALTASCVEPPYIAVRSPANSINFADCLLACSSVNFPILISIEPIRLEYSSASFLAIPKEESKFDAHALTEFAFSLKICSVAPTASSKSAAIKNAFAPTATNPADKILAFLPAFSKLLPMLSSFSLAVFANLSMACPALSIPVSSPFTSAVIIALKLILFSF